VRRFGEITVNDSGDKLINIWKQHDLKICNIYFEHKYVYRYTWERQAYWLNYNQKIAFKIQDARVKWGLNCGSDYT